MEGKDVYVGFEFITDPKYYSFANFGGEQRVCRVTHITNIQIFWDVEERNGAKSYHRRLNFEYDDCIDTRSFSGWFRNVHGQELHRIPDWEV